MQDIFWEASVDEIKEGYIFDENNEEFTCIVCGKGYREGIIYPFDGVFLEAKLAIRQHIQQEHESMFQYLINMNKKYTGLTEHQKVLLQYFHEGLSDKQITNELGGSTSTIRNYRFTFKEKEKQAKIFLAIMKLLNNNEIKDQSFISIHKGATMVDERYAITEQERKKVVKTYFKEGEDGPLSSFPSKEKRKIVILQQIIKHFERNRQYSEMEVNKILKRIYDDFVTLRRYLIEYGFMERTKSGSEYWVKH